MKAAFLGSFFVMFLVYPLHGQHLVTGFESKVAGTPYHLVSGDKDDNILVFGYFDLLNGKYPGSLAKLDASGEMLSSFNGVYTDGTIVQAHALGDGKILIRGDFTKINDVPVSNLVRLNADGSLDPSFNSAVANAGEFRLQSDGRIIVVQSGGLVRLNSDGTADDTFAMTGFFYLSGPLAVGPDDYIYITTFKQLYRLKPNGEEDEDFNTGTGTDISSIGSIAVQSDGKILIAGYFTKYNDHAANSLVRLLPDGNIDTGFNVGVGPTGQIFEVTQRANGNILVGGQFYQFNNQAANLVELKPSGSVHRVIAVVQTNSITSIVETPDGRITIGGEFSSVNGVKREFLAKFNTDYTIANSFAPQLSYQNPNGRFLHVRDNGAVITGGATDFHGVFAGTTLIRKKIAQLDAFGVYDETFALPFQPDQPHINSSLLQEDGKLILSGGVSVNGPTIARFNIDGTRDNTFAIGAGPTSSSNNAATVYAMSQRNDKLFLGGAFQKFAGISSQSLVAVDLAGQIVKTYSVLPPETHLHEIAFQSDGKIILLGTFPFETGTTNIVRLDADGGLDETFQLHSLVGNPYVVEIDLEDRVYVGGDLYTVNGALVGSIVRLLPDGNLDTNFSTGTGFEGGFGDVRSIAVLPDGNIAIGGHFDTYNSHEANGFVIVDEQGEPVSTPLVRFGRKSAVNTIEVANNGMYLGGRLVRQDYKDVDGTVKIALEPISLPEAPGDVTVELHEAGIARIRWGDNSDTEFAFILERSADDETHFVPIDTVHRNIVSTFDSQIVAHVQYFYRIKAVNDAGVSGYSNTASFLWFTAPQGDLLGSVTEHTETELLLSWQWTGTGHQGFIIERSEVVNSNYETIDTVSVSTFTYIDAVERGKKYFYKVAAYNSLGRVLSNEMSSIISSANRESQSLSVFPVPAQTVLYVRSLPMQQNGRWQLINSSGQALPIRPHTMGEIIELPIFGVPAGTYVLQHMGPKGNMSLARVIVVR